MWWCSSTFLDLGNCALEVLVYGYYGCFHGFQRLEKIDGEIVVSVLKLFAEKEKKKKSICHW